MKDLRQITGILDGSSGRFGIVAARFNCRLVELLIRGAIESLERHGTAAEAVELVRVPGAWEIPLALDALAQKGRYSGLIALGVVIRGETPHFDYICTECARGCARVSEQHRMPLGFGVLTCETTPQAEERAGGKAGNKGEEAALAMLEMVSLLGRLEAE